MLARQRPDAVVLATGSRPTRPPIEDGGDIAIIDAADLLAGRATTGKRVVIYDWLADWIGVGIAEKLARDGAHVRLAVNGVAAAINIQNYIRDEKNAILHTLGVEVLPYMRLYGATAGTAYFLHTAAQSPVVLDGVDTIVLACPNTPNDELLPVAQRLGIAAHLIGDALAPRTAEEAVYEGLKVANDL